MSLPYESRSLWIATTPETSYAALAGDLDVDVAIVGAGLTGLVAAWLLTEAGKQVAVLEQGRIVSGETGNTTAHVTELVDTRYHVIEHDFGREGARLVARSNHEAIDWIERTSSALAIACSFERVPAYLYTERAGDMGFLRKEFAAAERAGVPVELVDYVPLPFPTAGALRVARQAQFHPRDFLLPLADRIAARGGRIFELTRMTGVTDGEPCEVETSNGTVRARDVIVAANVPANNWAALITKLPAYRTYAIAARGGATIPRGLYWDTDDPYHYTRTQPSAEGEVLIIGGEDHKTGTETETLRHFESLLDYARSRFDVEHVDYRWSGQIIEPVDGLPYIGLNTASDHVYVATGYSGNGMTFATVAGQLTSDLVLGRPNPYADVYRATRVKPLAAAKDFITENIDFPKYLVRDRTTNADVQGDNPALLAKGTGKLMAINGVKYAVYRAEDGQLHSLSPICPHMHCDVAWNNAERSWDCPCHGSRFTPTGEVLNGPAVTSMVPLQLPGTNHDDSQAKRGS
jgi:glycine/D-amino acid oxidase-like deaminating enzyme/nitrite reductase/ring-hydroxylating ferredoxin subunit